MMNICINVDSNAVVFVTPDWITSKICDSTVKPVLRGHSKIDKIKVLKTNGSLMKVESIAECSLGAFCNTFYLH